MAKEIVLTIEPDRKLPYLIVVDLGPVEPILVFAEVVATAGSVNEWRQAALMNLAMDTGFKQGKWPFE